MSPSNQANHTPENQALSLAAIFQAAFLAKNLAVFGRCDVDQLEESLASILKLDAESVPEIFGGRGNLRKGLRTLRTQLKSTGQQRDLDISRYTAALIQLSDNLQKQPQTLDHLRQELIRLQSLEFSLTDQTMINAFATVYRNCISQLSPRILISGKPEYLNNDDTASRIRASLLSGVRASVLWRQCGGTKPGLLFGRHRYLRAADNLLHL